MPRTISTGDGMYSSILVPLDGSPFAERALPVAQAIARRHGATLHLLSVHALLVQPFEVQGAPVYDTTFDDERRREQAEYVQRTVERLRGEGVTVDGAMVRGDAVGPTLAEEARRHGAGLIVMTTHGRGGFTRAWIGSVASEVVRTAPVPVLLVRAPDDETGEAAAPTATFPVEAPHLLVPVDGSALAEAAVPAAVDFGDPLGARYTFMRVVRTADSLLPYDQTFWTPAEQAVMDAQRVEAERYVDTLVARWRAKGHRVDGLVVLESDVARTILRAVEGERVDALVLSTHARGMVGRVFLGSIADKVVRAADRPVLVVRPPEPEA